MNKDKNFFLAENISTGRQNSRRWVEDSFVPATNSTAAGQPQFLNLALTDRRLKLFLLFLIAGLAVLWGKSFYLQVIRGQHYFALAEDNRTQIKYVKAQRGVFYDQTGEVLARNISGFSLFITPVNLPREESARQAVLEQVATIVGLDAAEIESKISDRRYYFQPIPIQTGIDYERALALKIASADLPGVSLEADSWRQYLAGPSFAHLLGYVGKITAEEYENRRADYLFSDNIGKTGLEKYYEELLRGRHGQQLVEVDALGQEQKQVASRDFVPGQDLVLTIDAALQNRVYEILAARLKDDKAAAVIISDPDSGEILALVDYPNYDNNLFATGIGSVAYQELLADERKPLFMRSIAGEYPSGSTVKLVIAAAALNEEVVNRQTTFNSVGGLWVGGQWFFPDWKAGGHGLTNVIKAIAESVNTYFYYVGGGYGDFAGLGIDRLARYLRLFGIGEPLGIDLPGEKAGFVPSQEWKETVKNEPWYIGDTYHLAIGQGDILVTPLQVNAYTVAIANGGVLYRPRLVKEIVQADGRREIIIPEVIRKDFIRPENIAIVREGMRQAVLAGSAASLQSLPVTAAGKTGTAQWNSNKENHAWFTAFAPYERPELVITVLVEEGGEGSAIAAPIAREILAYWFGR